jgi:hypothetical protein
MSVVNLFDSLNGAKTINGTWSYVSGPALKPAPPVAYNDDIDFDTFTYDTYVYRYTVVNGSCNDTSDVTIIYREGLAPVNEVCATAKVLTYNTNSATVLLGERNDGNCNLNLAAPTDSGVAEPTSWSSITSYTGDLWYKVNVVLNNGDDPKFTIAIDGSQYSTSGVNTPMLAIYNGTCGALVDVNDQVGFGSRYIESAEITTSGANDTYYVRVASEEAGLFDVIVSGDVSIALQTN